MNKVIFIGRIASDITMRQTQNGKSMASFSIAVERNRKVDGQPTADFFNASVFGATADFVGKYLKKGSQVSLCGSIQNRSYTDKEGNKRYTTDVIVDDLQSIGARENGNQNANRNAAQKPAPQNATAAQTIPEDLGIDREDLPF